jgi:hypothetical protein
MKLKFNGFLVLLVVLVAQITFAQERTVSGVVSDMQDCLYQALKCVSERNSNWNSNEI